MIQSSYRTDMHFHCRLAFQMTYHIPNKTGCKEHHKKHQFCNEIIISDWLFEPDQDAFCHYIITESEATSPTTWYKNSLICLLTFSLHVLKITRRSMFLHIFWGRCISIFSHIYTSISHVHILSPSEIGNIPDCWHSTNSYHSYLTLLS